jgi:hypothetical protein
MMNMRQSRPSLAEMSACSRMMSWKRGTLARFCFTAKASSRMSRHFAANFRAFGKNRSGSSTAGV